MTDFSTVAVIGSGSIAARHRCNIKKVWEKSRVCYIPTRPRLISDLPEFADFACYSIEQFIEQYPDAIAVIVASPAPFHFKHVSMCLEHRLPVLQEKPMATNYQDAVSLIELAELNSVPLMVGYCLRYLSSAKFLKEYIAQNQIEIFSVIIESGSDVRMWRKNTPFNQAVSLNKDLGGGVLLELSHEFDYAHWLFGPLEVLAAKLQYNLDFRVETVADLLLETEIGAAVNVHLDFLQKTPRRVCSMLARDGNFLWDINSNRVFKDGVSLWDGIEGNEAMYLKMLMEFAEMVSKPFDINMLGPAREACHIMGYIESIREVSGR